MEHFHKNQKAPEISSGGSKNAPGMDQTYCTKQCINPAKQQPQEQTVHRLPDLLLLTLNGR